MRLSSWKKDKWSIMGHLQRFFQIRIYCQGGGLSQVALLSHEMKMLDKPFDYITITKSQTKEQIMKRMGL